MRSHELLPRQQHCLDVRHEGNLTWRFNGSRALCDSHCMNILLDQEEAMVQSKHCRDQSETATRIYDADSRPAETCIRPPMWLPYMHPSCVEQRMTTSQQAPSRAFGIFDPAPATRRHGNPARRGKLRDRHEPKSHLSPGRNSKKRIALRRASSSTPSSTASGRMTDRRRPGRLYKVSSCFTPQAVGQTGDCG